MKKPSKIFLIIFPLLFIGAGCDEEQNLSSCLSGTVFGYEYCTNAILVEVDSQSVIGDKLIFNDSEFQNAIRSPIKGQPYQVGDVVFFTYRQYKEEDDNDLFDFIENPCNQYEWPLDVPTIVITQSSTSNCPSTNENNL